MERVRKERWENYAAGAGIEGEGSQVKVDWESKCWEKESKKRSANVDEREKTIEEIDSRKEGRKKREFREDNDTTSKKTKRMKPDSTAFTERSVKVETESSEEEEEEESDEDDRLLA